ncbi:MAG: hypothetical protein ACJ765_06465 [Chloroflexota bacterium]
MRSPLRRIGGPLARCGLLAVMVGLLGGCGIAASTAVASFSAEPVAPAATVSPAVAQARVAISSALAGQRIALQDAKQPFRPAESPLLAAAPRSVFQAVLPQDPEGGFIVVYEFRDPGAAVDAGNEYAGYVGSGGPGKVQFPNDVQHVIRQLGTTLLVYSYAPSVNVDPGSPKVADALNTLGIGFAPPR